MLFSQLDLNENQTAFLMAIKDIGMAICIGTYKADDLDVLGGFKRYMSEMKAMELVGLVELYKNKTATPDDILLAFGPFVKYITEEDDLENIFSELKEDFSVADSTEEVQELCNSLISLSKTGEIYSEYINKKTQDLDLILGSINEFDLLDDLYQILLEYDNDIEDDEKIDDLIIILCACLSRYEVSF